MAAMMTAAGTILHGADYNPDQWLAHPEKIDDDFRLMPLAGLTAVTLGVFAWSRLEPEEGRFDFGWMDAVFARAGAAGLRIFLATPSGGKPHWLAQRYPEVRRVGPDGRREPPRGRHNHCPTSPVYREKVAAVNARLAERYGRRPALALWHVSNEYGGYCYCDLCFAAFRGWLRARYGEIGRLNEAYWAHFWSHAYSDWSEIVHIDETVHGLQLDWRRFMTRQCAEFLRAEAEPLRRLAPGIPVTTNFHQTDDYDYVELAKEIDVVSWDSYPRWHGSGPGDETATAAATALRHDLHRGMKGGAPFLLMETTPSQTNWFDVSPLLRPGMLRLNGLLAVAHGADSVCYFQFRPGRGGSEKYHGTVVGHAGHERTRVFQEVAAFGTTLSRLGLLEGARVPARAALLFDWENLWALEQAQSPQNRHKEYHGTCLDHYRPLWERSVPMDVVDGTADLAPYRLVVAPMLHLLRDGIAERLEAFVRGGGTLVATYQTGHVDPNDLCFPGGAPGPLRRVLGVWVEESDALPDPVRRPVVAGGGRCGLSGAYEARHHLDLLHAETAEILAVYGDDFYAGRPALTVNALGKGRAYYIASRNEPRFQGDFYAHLAAELSLEPRFEAPLPAGVVARFRVDSEGAYLFLFNLRPAPAAVRLGTGFRDAESGEPAGEPLPLAGYGARVLRVPEASFPAAFAP